MFRRFLIAVLIFIIAIVVAADRIGALVAAHVLAGKVQTDEGLPNRPDVTIGGLPFLTQAFGGQYKDVTIKAVNFPVGGMAVNSLTATLHGVHIPLGKVTHDSVSRVPVDRINGTAFISLGNINAYLSRHSPAGQRLSLRARGGGDSATVVDRVRAAGKSVALQGVGSLSVVGNVIEIAVSDLKGFAGSIASSALVQHVLSQLKIVLPLRSLPFRIALQSVRIAPAGITATGSAFNVVLGSKPT